MEDITPEAMQLVQEGAAHFVEVVRRAAERSQGSQESSGVYLTLDAFYDNPMLLYAALWYAASNGVVITFLPRQRTDRKTAARTSSGGQKAIGLD